MFKPKRESQNEAEFVFIEDLVPEDHLLRKVNKYIDFSFIGEKVRPFYSENNGRPSLKGCSLVIFMAFVPKDN